MFSPDRLPDAARDTPVNERNWSSLENWCLPEKQDKNKADETDDIQETKLDKGIIE